MNISASSLARSFQELYNSTRDEQAEIKTDFTIFCGDKQFPVHSVVLAARSAVFMKMVLGDFKEKKEREIRIKGFSSKTVEQIVHFLYGFELSDEFDEIEVEELLALGEMYEIADLKSVAALNFNKYVFKDNVFDIAEVAEKYNADEVFEKCVEFIVDNFKIQDLLENGILIKLPKLPLAILKKRPEVESVVRVFKSIHDKYLFDYKNGQMCELQFSVDEPIELTGLGLFVSPDSVSKLTADIELFNWTTCPRAEANLLVSSHFTLLNTEKDKTMVKVSLPPTILTPNIYNDVVNIYTLTALIRGHGFSAAGTGGTKEVTADGLNKGGEFVKKVTFTFNGDLTEPGQIPEFFFNVL